MSDRNRILQYHAFCEGLKDSLSAFKAWEDVQTGVGSSNAFASQVAQRALKGCEAPPPAAPVVSAPAQAKTVTKSHEGSSEGEARTSGWGAVRDRALEALRSGPMRCADIVRKVIELSPEDQRPEGDAEKKKHYTTVNNGLHAMLKDQFVAKESRELDNDKTPTAFWSITEKGRTYLAELGK